MSRCLIVVIFSFACFGSVFAQPESQPLVTIQVPELESVLSVGGDRNSWMLRIGARVSIRNESEQPLIVSRDQFQLLANGQSIVPGLPEPVLPLLQPSQDLTDLLSVAGALPFVPNVTGQDAGEGTRGIINWGGLGGVGALSAAGQIALNKRLFNGAPLTGRPVNASLPERLFGLDRPRVTEGDGVPRPSVTDNADLMFESLWPLAAKVPFGTRGESEKSTSRLGSMLTGLKLQQLGPQAQDSEAYRRLDELDRYMASLYDQGVLTQGEDAGAVRTRLRAQASAAYRDLNGLDPSADLSDADQQVIDDEVQAMIDGGDYG